MFRCATNCLRFNYRRLSTSRTAPLVLGIETSCDDTGCAIVDGSGRLLGESLHSQQSSHLRFGGIIPPVAQEFHRANMESVVERALAQAELRLADLDAIAVTNRPGLPLSLIVGLRYAKHLARKHDKPLIPVHHMEAHALTVRMTTDVPFPFLCLLVSGGHSLLAFVAGVDKFLLLGETLDDAPGEALDKIARRLKLRNVPRYEQMAGGQAIEAAALMAKTDCAYEFPLPLSKYRDCQFSFAGLKNAATRHILEQEHKMNLPPDALLPNYEDFCASFLKGITRHILHRTQRAIQFCEANNLFSDGDSNQRDRHLVVSGGVACNDVIFDAVSRMAKHFQYKSHRPPKHHCRDNGTMIAWNGVEKFVVGTEDITKDYDRVDISGKAPLGISQLEDVAKANISCQWIKEPVFPGLSSR